MDSSPVSRRKQRTVCGECDRIIGKNARVSHNPDGDLKHRNCRPHPDTARGRLLPEGEESSAPNHPSSKV